MKLEQLQDLFLDELKDVYHAEKQILKALPKMAAAASNPDLKKAFDNHLAESQVHVERLEKVFEMLDRKPAVKVCKGMQGLIEEGEELIKEKPSSEVLDAGLIGAAQRVEHYEMAAYGCLRTYARQLGHKDIQKILQTTLDEEGAADVHLTKLAESRINEAAI